MSEGLVEIKRRKGRIAGFGGPKFPLHTLWCGSNRPRKKFGQRRDGWSFPPAVRELLLQQTVGKTAVHLFGGRADFGVRLDIDPATQPHYIGDAWDPPFPKDSFDVVILDPPYIQLRQEQKSALLRSAAWIAKEHVFWFHTLWANGHRTLPIVEAWLIRVGDQCQIRCLEKFAALQPKQEFVAGAFRGPQQTYNRWGNPMGQHYTRNTVSAAAFCKKCDKSTQHRVDDRRLGPCLDCIARLTAVSKSNPRAAGGQIDDRQMSIQMPGMDSNRVISPCAHPSESEECAALTEAGSV